MNLDNLAEAHADVTANVVTIHRIDPVKDLRIQAICDHIKEQP